MVNKSFSVCAILIYCLILTVLFLFPRQVSANEYTNAPGGRTIEKRQENALYNKAFSLTGNTNGSVECISGAYEIEGTGTPAEDRGQELLMFNKIVVGLVLILGGTMFIYLLERKH